MILDTMPNYGKVAYKQTHIIAIPPLCPVSHNPMTGSTLVLSYIPKKCVLEVYSIEAFIKSFVHGREWKGVFIRDMEQTIHVIHEHAQDVLETFVYVRAKLILDTQDLHISLGRIK